MQMKPTSLKTVPAGCCIVLGDCAKGVMSWCGSTNEFRPFPDLNAGATPWPILSASPDNPYGLLPWDIPIPDGYEPDGEWEPKDGEKAAYREPKAGDTILGKECIRLDPSHCVMSVATGSSWVDETRLCIRSKKTKRTVVEIELEAGTRKPMIGLPVHLNGFNTCSDVSGTITDVREVER